MQINKESYKEKLTYDLIKTAFRKHLYNFTIDRTSILEPKRRNYYLRQIEELHNIVEITFKTVEMFGSGKDSFVSEFAELIAAQNKISNDYFEKARAIDKSFGFLKVPQHGNFYWNFEINYLQHFGISGAIPHLTNNIYNDCRELDLIFDLSILCSKIIAVYMPGLKRDIKSLDYLELY